MSTKICIITELLSCTQVGDYLSKHREGVATNGVFIATPPATADTPPATTDIVVYEPPSMDGRRRNKGAAKRHRYTLKEKYDIIEKCEETIAHERYPEIRNATQYFQEQYRNHDTAHKFICLYGKWNKPNHRKRMVDYILGKNFAAIGRKTMSPYHHMENALYAEIVKKRKSGHCVTNIFICICAIVLFKQMQEEGIPVY